MKYQLAFSLTVLLNLPYSSMSAQERIRDLGIQIGILSPGPLNAITDVGNIRVGHTTLIEGDHIRTGVTAILPHTGNLFQEKVPAAVFVGNGFGKLAGSTQIKELGNLETPIVLTNTLSVATAMHALIGYTLYLPGNESVRSVNAVVGETNDGYLNDIRGRHITEEHVLQAIESARGGPVAEGNVGAGTGTICFGFKGGIGTASRVLPEENGGYTLGVLVQTNFGGVLEINGVNMAKELEGYPSRSLPVQSADGSCMIVVATDAPLDARNLQRVARRALFGLAKTGGIASNGSGDYVIAFSTAPGLRIPSRSESATLNQTVLRNTALSPLFLAAIEATEEAILNALFAAETMVGRDGHEVQALPVENVIELLRRFGRIKE